MLDTELLPSSIQVRCPECFKLYSVNAAEIHEPRPKFECVDCHSRFWIPYPEAAQNPSGIIGFRTEWLETTVEPVILTEKVFDCPKCGERYAAGDVSCVKCEIIFQKFAEQKTQSEAIVESSKDIRYLWDETLNDYNNFSRHQTFINVCLSEQNLEYAAHQYKIILNVMPHDEMALQAQKEITHLSAARFESVTPSPETGFKNNDLIILGYRLSDMADGIQNSLRKMKFTNIIMVLCGFVIAAGFLIPGLRNLIGFGSSILFFIVALRYYFRVI